MNVKEKLINERDLAKENAKALVALAETEKRELTEDETKQFESFEKDVLNLDSQITGVELMENEAAEQKKLELEAIAEQKKLEEEALIKKEKEELQKAFDDAKNEFLRSLDELDLEDKDIQIETATKTFEEGFGKAENKTAFTKGIVDEIAATNKKEEIKKNNEEKMGKFNLSKALVDMAKTNQLGETEAKKVNDLSELTQVATAGAFVEMKDFNTTSQSGNIDQNAVMPLSIIGKKPVWQMMGVRYLPNLRGTITLPHKDPVTAAALAEKAAITHDTVTAAGVSLAPARIGAAQIWTKELLASENPELHSAMVSDMLLGIDRKISADVYAKAFAGSTEVTGVALTKAGFDTLMGAADIDGDGAFASARTTFFEAKSVAIDAGSGRFLATLGGGAGVTYDGVPYFFSNLFVDAANTKYVLYGDFYSIVVGDWGMFEVIVNPYTYAKEGQLEIVVNRIINVALQNPDAFVVTPDLDPAA